MSVVDILYKALTTAALAESASAKELGENIVEQIIYRLDEDGVIVGGGTICRSNFDFSYFDGWKRYKREEAAMNEYGVDYEVMKQELRERLDAEGRAYDEEGIDLAVYDDSNEFYAARCWEVTENNGRGIVVSFLVKGKKDLKEALRVAVELGYPSLIKSVLADGAMVNARINSDYETALLVAVRLGYVECLKLLIDAGADITGGKGTEALDYADRYGQVACKNVLRDAGVGRKVRSKKQKS